MVQCQCIDSCTDKRISLQAMKPVCRHLQLVQLVLKATVPDTVTPMNCLRFTSGNPRLKIGKPLTTKGLRFTYALQYRRPVRGTCVFDPAVLCNNFFDLLQLEPVNFFRDTQHKGHPAVSTYRTS